jgi:hypothetical protein
VEYRNRYTLENTEGAIKMNNPEELATLGTKATRRRHTNKKNNAICVGHHYTETNKHIVNKA